MRRVLFEKDGFMHLSVPVLVALSDNVNKNKKMKSMNEFGDGLVRKLMNRILR